MNDERKEKKIKRKRKERKRDDFYYPLFAVEEKTSEGDKCEVNHKW